jgi:hypothetical protein
MSAPPCAQFVVGRNVLRTLGQRSRRSTLCLGACCQKCGGAAREPAQIGSWQPSSETHKFEHRQPARRAKGAVKGHPGRRDERPRHGLIDADHHQCGQGHEHIGPTQAFRGLHGHANSLRSDRSTLTPRRDIGLRHHRDLDATGVSVIAIAGLRVARNHVLRQSRLTRGSLCPLGSGRSTPSCC